MYQYNLVKAERIASCIVDCVSDLVAMACEDMDDGVAEAVWGMISTHIAFRSGRGECFVLPSLDDC